MNLHQSKFIKNSLNIDVENIDPNDTTGNRYNRDNTIYKNDREFVFKYYLLKNDSSFKMHAPSPNRAEDFDKEWNLVDTGRLDFNTVSRLSIKVVEGVGNENQSRMRILYHCGNPGSMCPYNETTGLIENSANLWMHPPRIKLFRILEINPFPYVRFPLQIGNKWSTDLDVGEHWGDYRWTVWSGSVTIKSNYEVIDKVVLKTKIGNKLCWVIKSAGTSLLGSTELTMFFNDELGFLKLDYKNINTTHVVFEIDQINN